MDIKTIPFRKDEYSTSFFIEKGKNIEVFPVKDLIKTQGLVIEFSKSYTSDILKFSIKIKVENDIDIDRFGMRLGIDCYMEKYPDWDKKLFPTALRCEKKGFWGCFCSPQGDMLAVASSSDITSWSNEYSHNYDVGHRIYTSSLDFVNVFDLPKRHFIKKKFIKGESLEYEIYFSFVKDRQHLYDFVKKYAKIEIPLLERFVYDKNSSDLDFGRHIISKQNQAETSVYIRHDWFYYFDKARKDAEISQQKAGTHVESWYGFYTLAAYAKIINDSDYTKYVKDRFDNFLKVLCKKSLGGHIRMKKKALPYRLQNVSGMISLLADFYELTKEEKYLDYALDFAKYLMSLQYKDGSYRSKGCHYTAVIYPAKSMLELAITEKEAGRNEFSDLHAKSAERAIEDLYRRKDNIGTEGEMTFEDGMISCEVLQLAFLALQKQGDKKQKFTLLAEEILKKHRCFEQNIIPDCRTFGATLRFWEARYDINFFVNMLNTPHGWTSWKNYATYYLYLLTGKRQYLLDTINTFGACMQLVDKYGRLNWAFVPDPFIRGRRMVKASNKMGFEFVEEIVGETYLEKISDWYRQEDGKLPMQYIRYIDRPNTWKKDLGGSCDNDVHEHFKCLHETLFGRAFIHIEKGEVFLENCYLGDKGYMSDDKYVKKYIVYSDNDEKINIEGDIYKLQKGFNEIELKR